MYYYGEMAFLDESFLKEYSSYGKIERLTCILTQSINEGLSSFSFSAHTHIILVEISDSLLVYHWFDQTHVRLFRIRIDNLKSFANDRMAEIVYKRFETMRAEGIVDRNWTVLGDVQSLCQYKGSKIYMIAVADSHDYPKSKLWKHVVDVFVQQWCWNLEDIEHNELINSPAPELTIKKVDYHWSITHSSCCRLMEEGGFDTGYGDPYGSEVMFDALCYMSTNRYETREAHGTIVPLSNEEEPVVSLIHPIPIYIENFRIIRKFLEMAKDGLALAFRRYEFVGLTKPELYNSQVKITGTNRWEYLKNNETMFAFDNGFIKVGRQSSDLVDSFSVDQGLRNENTIAIQKIVRESMRQCHGTLVIFSDAAESEAQRLARYHRCEMIKPINLINSLELVIHLTSVDGALIVDFNGMCYAVGAILDGEAVKPGNTGRGARYNSAVNYVAWKRITSPTEKYLAVIISEDGIMNCVSTDEIDNYEEDIEN